MDTKHPTKTSFEPGNGYTQEDWGAVHSPELTDEEIANMRPVKEVLPTSFFKGLTAARKTS